MATEVQARGSICCGCILARYVLAILGSVGMGIIYGLKVNLSVAIVSMVNYTAASLEVTNNPVMPNASIAGCPTDSGATQKALEDGPFIWSGTVKGAMLSSYFWGYLVTQIPGGRIAELFSAKWVMFFAVAINVVCTIFTPLSAKLHYIVMIVMRIGEGIGGGVTFPAMHVMLAHWAPPAERSVMSSIVYAGTALGTVVFTLFAGIIAASWGWEAIFYIEGGVSALWLLFWAWLIADNANTQSYISPEEREFLNSALSTAVGSESRTLKMPWKSVLKSLPFWAILICHTAANWGWYMLLMELPLFLKSVLNFSITENATLTAVPYLCMWIFSLVWSKIMDTLRAKKIITTTTARKASSIASTGGPMLCFLALCFTGCDKVFGVLLMTGAVTFLGAAFSGYLGNHIDISPNFAGTLMALTNTFATLSGIIVPVFVEKLTASDPSISSWRLIFTVTICFYIVAILVFGIFASGEQQKWNSPSDAAEG